MTGLTRGPNRGVGVVKILLALTLSYALGMDGVAAQSSGDQSQQSSSATNGQSTSQPQQNTGNSSQSAQDVPDAPSTVQPPPPPTKIPEPPPDMKRPPESRSAPSDAPAPSPESTPPPATVQTIPPGTGPKNQLAGGSDIYTIPISVNFVQVPVTVNDSSGRRVDGLLPADFSIYENGKKQTLTYFSSDPFLLSVAVVLDVGLPDVTLQEVSKTYSALAGSLSHWDEAALYTYNTNVSQVTDYNQGSTRLLAALNQMKLVRGGNGPAVLDGPLAENGPMINGLPVGGGPAPVNTPPRESHVLNDAILRAALDLGKRGRERRKVIFVISDGQELGSQSSYRDVLRILQSRNIEVKAVVVDMGALPGFRQLERLPRLKTQGYSDILPRYSHATGGGDVLKELTRNAIEAAYDEIASEARNQYTLGYAAKPISGSSGYRSIDVHVDRKGLKVIAKDGFYLTPTPR
jgi:VWFA-related protein